MIMMNDRELEIQGFQRAKSMDLVSSSTPVQHPKPRAASLHDGPVLQDSATPRNIPLQTALPPMPLTSSCLETFTLATDFNGGNYTASGLADGLSAETQDAPQQPAPFTINVLPNSYTSQAAENQQDQILNPPQGSSLSSITQSNRDPSPELEIIDVRRVAQPRPQAQQRQAGPKGGGGDTQAKHGLKRGLASGNDHSAKPSCPIPAAENLNASTNHVRPAPAGHTIQSVTYGGREGYGLDRQFGSSHAGGPGDGLPSLSNNNAKSDHSTSFTNPAHSTQPSASGSRHGVLNSTLGQSGYWRPNVPPAQQVPYDNPQKRKGPPSHALPHPQQQSTKRLKQDLVHQPPRASAQEATPSVQNQLYSIPPYVPDLTGFQAQNSSQMPNQGQRTQNRPVQTGSGQSKKAKDKAWTARSWTPYHYAQLANTCQNNFPFHDFELKHGKSHAEVQEVFAATVMAPVLAHGNRGKGEARGGLGEERVKERRKAQQEMSEIHRKYNEMDEKEKREWRDKTRREIEAETMAKFEREGWVKIQDVENVLNEKKKERERQAGAAKGKGGEDEKSKGESPVPGSGLNAGRGRKTNRVKTVEEATKELQEASAELTKAQKAEERKAKKGKKEETEEDKAKKEELKRKRAEKKL